MDVTVAGLFMDDSTAKQAVKSLLDAGYGPDCITVVGRDAAVSPEAQRQLEQEADEAESDPPGGTTLSDTMAGGVLGGILGLVVGVATVVLPGSLVVIGPLAGLLGGTALGATAGAVVGSLRDLGLDEDEAHGYLTSIEAGAILVAVHAKEQSFHRPERILTEAGARDVHVVRSSDEQRARSEE